MDNNFEVTILYRNVAHEFPARLIAYGYSYKIEVELFGKTITFERDDERNFRAILHYDDIGDAHKIDKELLQKIIDELEKI